ncbi:MAG: hypothetical protein J4N29_05570 [Chloroflexi bacterium]|nr:hypothetical protein [Chloroflexota bacterium]
MSSASTLQETFSSIGRLGHPHLERRQITLWIDGQEVLAAGNGGPYLSGSVRIDTGDPVLWDDFRAIELLPTTP